ncbi:efflux RND transporter periplasmic adaptor subunit [Sphingomonas prati]|uniref:Membrane fusion protein (Multidrug efflux system) n=1 Tax=Sphingomonas prati TaxID=1843237 RepID=A0A7W9F1R1_9SPHN|nr:efflux RND transporter periplasmic adaptor subunit [Sphingomonas prati]MBB5727685.1 membrane fusion protein (multidrug efflux system) [Sphingomonas prati]GGE79885.1 hemolysin D [Sphingomonas prati]
MFASLKNGASGVTLAFALALLLPACAQEAPPAPPPPEVEIVTIQPTSVAHVVELPGRVAAIRTAEVRARVDGIVERRTYEEGTDVRAGQLLFRVDPRERRADFEAAQATLRRSEASARNAAQVVARYQPLVGQQAISKQEYDAAVAQQRTGQADVANARAQADRARLTLNYTNVVAPISGRAGRAEVTEGALVSATGATLLTRIEQLDPIYVNFSQSSSDLMQLRRDIAAGLVKTPNLNKVQVSLALEDGTPYGPKGRLDFLDMSVDESTGTVSLRAEFPNPNRYLLPGQFVRAKVSAGTDTRGITVPQRAVTIGPKGATVMIVGQNNIATVREIRVGDLQGSNWVVTEGLRPGDRVIVNGAQKAQPGAPVRIAAPAGRRPAAASPAAPAAAQR